MKEIYKEALIKSLLITFYIFLALTAYFFIGGAIIGEMILNDMGITAWNLYSGFKTSMYYAIGISLNLFIIVITIISIITIYKIRKVKRNERTNSSCKGFPARI